MRFEEIARYAVLSLLIPTPGSADDTVSENGWKVIQSVVTLGSIVATLVFVSEANARDVFCHPGMPSVEWNGERWQMPDYSGPLEVAIDSSFGQTVVSCVRNSIQMSAAPKGKCHFKAGTTTSVRTYKKMQWTVCRTDKIVNTDECVVQCDD